MTDFKAPRTEIEWRRGTIISVVGVLAAHADSLTLVGACVGESERLAHQTARGLAGALGVNM